MRDKHGQKINLGDTLKSDFNYCVIVTQGERGWVGKLICKPGHSCEDIPYHLNNGKYHTKVKENDER